MTRVVELGRDLLVAPTAAAQAALSGARDGALVLIFLLGAAAQALSAAVADGRAPASMLALVCAAVLGAAVLVFCGGALLHLSAGLLGGQGTPANLLRVCALAYYPNLLLPPFALAGGGLFWLARSAIFAWQLLVLVIGLREVYRSSTGVAVVSLALPAALVLFFLPLALLFMLLLGLLSAL